ncbi:MAG: hypothetical protein FWE84_06650, partial [Firmicutes bacterium]|nr:hypothetical protein [Bacillota bacterium]
MAKKILIPGVLLIMAFSLGACGNQIPYNAKIFYNAQALMNEEYLEANMTWDVSIQGEQVLGANLPPTRTHIITNKNSFDLAFSEFPQEIDLSEKMILVYFFTSSYPISPYKLEKVNLDGDTLHIQFKLNKSGSPLVPDAGLPR